MTLLLGLMLIVLCCLVIWRASDGFETASAYLGRNLSSGVRGATINAIGSSVPELFTTFFFFFYYAFVLDDPTRANDGFSGGIGTTAGSAIFNGMIIPAIVIFAVIGYGLAKQVEVSRKVVLRDGLSLIAAEIILIFLISGNQLHWWHGLALMSVYGVYLIITFGTMGPARAERVGEHYFQRPPEATTLHSISTLNLAPVVVRDSISTPSAWLLLLLSIVIIGGACFGLVYACELSARALGLNTYFVAVVLASAATSVPDTILSYRDALKGEYDDAVANALGSNIFDVCFALGFPLFVFALVFGSVEMNPAVVEDVTELRVLLLGLTLVAFCIYLFAQRLRRIHALLFLSIYVLFLVYILGKAYQAPWALEVGAALRNIIL